MLGWVAQAFHLHQPALEDAVLAGMLVFFAVILLASAVWHVVGVISGQDEMVVLPFLKWLLTGRAWGEKKRPVRTTVSAHGRGADGRKSRVRRP